MRWNMNNENEGLASTKNGFVGSIDATGHKTKPGRKMRLDALLWTILLCVGVAFWLYQDLKMSIDYERNFQLVDPATGKTRKPSEVLDLLKVINVTDEYIASTNAQERLYELEYMMNLENPVVLDHFYSSNRTLMLSGLPVANETRCESELGWIVDKFTEFEDDYTLVRGRLGFELTSLMDSFGKPEAGTHQGVVHWLGSYKGCMKTSLNGGKIKTRYCIGQMKFNTWPEEKIKPKTSVRVGICIPETCSTISFEKHGKLIEKLAKLDFPKHYKESLKLDSMFCLPDERSPIRKVPTAGYVFMTIVGGWIIVVLLASGLHEYLIRKKKATLNGTFSKEFSLGENGEKLSEIEPQRKSLVNELLSSLSLRVTVKEFKSDPFKVKHNSGQRVRVHLGCLDFFKIIFALLVVLGHSGYLSSVLSRNMQNRIEQNLAPTGRLILSIGRFVDTFFLFFGLLITYNLMKKFTRKQLANPVTWILVNLGIFLRITPIFMIVYFYNKTISPYSSQGPYWDYGVYKYSIRGQCMSEPWWSSIPYLGSSSTKVPAPSCNFPAWFLVSYSQISLLVPLITYLLWSLPSFFLKGCLVAGLSLLSTFSIGFKLFNQSSFRDEAFTLYGSMLADLMEKFESLGSIATFSRLGDVAIGCFTGFLINRFEVRKITEWPRWLRSNLTLTLVVLAQLVIIFLPLIGDAIYQQTGIVPSLNQIVPTHCITMLIFPILNALTIISMTTTNNRSLLVRFMSHSFWHIFNRLGFAIYLVHWEVIFVSLTSYEQAPLFSHFADMYKVWGYVLYCSILLAMIIYLFIESPISRLSTLLMKMALGSPANQIKSKQQQQQPNGKLETQLAG